MSVRFRRAWWAVGVVWALWSWLGDPVTWRWRYEYGAPPAAMSIWVWVLVDSRREQICAFYRLAQPQVRRIGFLATEYLRTAGL